MAYVYKHTRNDNGEIFYIGIGSDNKYKRANERSRRNNLWNKIVYKTNYTIEIIIDNISWNEACEIEKELISRYGRIDLKLGSLCNLTDGGEGTLGTKRIFSKETRIKMSEGAKGNKNMLGKKFSQEHKLNLSKSHLGHKVRDEIKDKISKSMIGIKNRKSTKLSEDHKSKLLNGWIGKNHSEESKEKIALKNGVKIIDNKTGKIYLSISKFANDLNLTNYKAKQLIGNNLNYSYYGFHQGNF